MRGATALRVALVLAGVSLFALGYAISELAHGVSEIPRHWWSTLPIMGLAAAVLLAWKGTSGQPDRRLTTDD